MRIPHLFVSLIAAVALFCVLGTAIGNITETFSERLSTPQVTYLKRAQAGASATSQSPSFMDPPSAGATTFDFSKLSRANPELAMLLVLEPHHTEVSSPIIVERAQHVDGDQLKDAQATASPSNVVIASGGQRR